MKRNDILEEFYVEQLKSGLDTLIELEEYCLNNRELLESELKNAFLELIMQIKKAQKDGVKKEIFCLDLCFLRSNFYMRNGNLRVYAYDQSFYLDDNPIWVDVDFHCLCELFWRLEDALSYSLKEYKNMVLESDVRTLIQVEYLPHLIGQITMITRSMIDTGVIDRGIGELSITDDFCILSGEYQGDFEEVLVTEILDTKGLQLKDFLRIHKKDTMTFCSKCFQEEVAAGVDLSEINFTKSRFVKMDYSGTDFSRSSLIGTDWQECNLSNTCWKDAELFGSFFVNSDLTGSDFSGVIAALVPENAYFQTASWWSGVRFTGTILKNANFQGADLRGADFRGAQFCDTNFNDAFLERAVFDRKSLEQVKLSEEQLEQIKRVN